MTVAPLDFTVLAPVHGGDDPAQFRLAMQSVAKATRPADAMIICQDGDLPEPLSAEVDAVAASTGARVIRNRGARGLAHNLNHAMTAVRTAFAARVDADDINLPDRFAAQIDRLDADRGIAVLGGGIIEFAPDGAWRRKSMPLTHDAIVRRARWRNPINHMTAFIDVQAFRACGGYPDIPYKEDYALWLTMIARGFRLANLDQDVVDARLGAGFHARRSGAHNLASEYTLFRLKRTIPALRATAAPAWLARSGALAFEGPARLIYQRVLRR